MSTSTLTPLQAGAKTMRIPKVMRNAPVVHFCTQDQSYYVCDKAGQYQRYTQRPLELFLGASFGQGKGGKSKRDKFLADVVGNKTVQMAGPLAGHPAGVVELSVGGRMLVVNSAKHLTPEPGSIDTILALLQGMFGSGDQLDTVLGWLKHGLAAVRDGAHQEGQMLVLAGPVNAFKSALQERITKLYGGRASDPHAFLAGDTSFNGELFGAEHWKLEDAIAEPKKRARLGAGIKKMVASRSVYCHGKGKQAYMLPARFRLTMSVNLEHASLEALPEYVGSVYDKIILTKVTPYQPAHPFSTPAEKERYFQQLDAELPAFAHYLSQYTVPTHLHDDRFGVKTYHDPDVLVLVRGVGLGEEYAFMSLLDGFAVNGWRGTSADLASQLSTWNHPRDQAILQHLRGNPGECGGLLYRCMARYPDRITQERRSNSGPNTWTVTSTPTPLPPTCQEVLW